MWLSHWSLYIWNATSQLDCLAQCSKEPHHNNWGTVHITILTIHFIGSHIPLKAGILLASFALQKSCCYDNGRSKLMIFSTFLLRFRARKKVWKREWNHTVISAVCVKIQRKQGTFKNDVPGSLPLIFIFALILIRKYFVAGLCRLPNVLQLSVLGAGGHWLTSPSAQSLQSLGLGLQLTCA